jgi:hypothetical protein
MKKLLTPFFLLIAVSFLSLAVAAQKPESKPSPPASPTPLKLERGSAFDGNVKFTEVEGWELSEKYQYPSAELGYSVNYEGPTSRVTVYVYTGGRKSIPAELGGIVADEMKKAKTELQAAVDAGLYEAADAGKTESITIAKEKGLVKTLYTPLKIKARGNQLHSEIFIFPYNNYFIKIRATHRNQEAATAEDFVALRAALDLLFAN